MKIVPECFPCFINQSLRAARFATDDPVKIQNILVEVSDYLFHNDFDDYSPAKFGSQVYRIVRKITGVNDPFKKAKMKHMNEVKSLLPKLNKMLEKKTGIEFRHSFRLHNAMKLAGVGNIIDLGVNNPINLDKEIERIFSVGLAEDVFPYFTDSLSTAKNLLYLTDNAGEIYFDLIFIDEILKNFNIKIFLGVKGAPTINDFTIDDLDGIELDKRIIVISNGCDAVGTVLSEISKEFYDLLNTVDIVLSKGQANFESLNRFNREIFFIFKMKCQPIADYTGFNRNDTVFIKNGDLKRNILPKYDLSRYKVKKITEL